MRESDFLKKIDEQNKIVSQLIIRVDILTRQVDYLLDVKNGKRLQP